MLGIISPHFLPSSSTITQPVDICGLVVNVQCLLGKCHFVDSAFFYHIIFHFFCSG